MEFAASRQDSRLASGMFSHFSSILSSLSLQSSTHPTATRTGLLFFMTALVPATAMPPANDNRNNKKGNRGRLTSLISWSPYFSVGLLCCEQGVSLLSALSQPSAAVSRVI